MNTLHHSNNIASQCYELRCSRLATLAGPTRLDQLERYQNRAPYSITGQLKTTPLEALRIEAGVPSITTQAQEQAAVA